MTDRDPTIPSTPDLLDTVTVYELLDRGELEAAISAVKKLTYNSLSDLDRIRDLKKYLRPSVKQKMAQSQLSHSGYLDPAPTTRTGRY